MKLLSPWGESLDRNHILPEYPRMFLQRDNYTSLNGEWEFQITDGSLPEEESSWETILVPFALGSALCGSERQLSPGETLWYRKRFDYPLTDNRVILHFEAVDQCAEVYLNGLPAGSHVGGYVPFSVDISDQLKHINELVVKVTDGSEQSSYAYGKQKTAHGGMWYTPSGGIWQSVWMEELKLGAVEDLRITPDFDQNQVVLQMSGTFSQAVITVCADRKVVHRGVTGGKEYVIPLADVHPWTPDDPFLYDLYIETEAETVKSYFGMRKFSAGKDENGITRFFLNNKPLFLSGLLDQGYSCDGLMTYPSEDAMVYEIRRIKSMGFNMLRKHVKQECRRWYYLCDKYGLLVMQDMPNGGLYDFRSMTLWPTLGRKKTDDHRYERFGRQSQESRDHYYHELSGMMETLYNHVSLFAWVPFNEGWGQFDSREITDFIKKKDPGRLVDSASGWFDQGAGDFRSIHNYFFPLRMPKADGRIILLSEFGGYAYLEKNHSMVEKLYGYRKYTDKGRLNDALNVLYGTALMKQIPKGLSGCIYTQVSDVEDECNGLLSADRKVVKVDEKMMRKNNIRMIRSVK